MTESQSQEDSLVTAFEPIYIEGIEEIEEIKDIEENKEIEEIKEISQVIESYYDDYIESESVLATEPVLVDLNKENGVDKAARKMNIAKLVYATFLLVLIILLIISILVRIRVQHKSVIFQTILLLILIATLVLFDFDFMLSIFFDN